MLAFFLAQHIRIDGCDTRFLALRKHIESGYHRNSKYHQRIAESNYFWILIGEDEWDEIDKYHRVKEDDKDLVTDTISFPAFVFVKRSGNAVCAFDQFFSEGFFFHELAPFLKIVFPKETVEVSLEAAGEIETEFQSWIVLVIFNHVDGLSRDTDIFGELELGNA